MTNFQFSHLNESVRELYTGKVLLADTNHSWGSEQEINWAALDKFKLCVLTQKHKPAGVRDALRLLLIKVLHLSRSMR